MHKSTIPGNHYASRKPIIDNRSFVFVGRDHFLFEQTGESGERSELHSWIHEWRGSNGAHSPAPLVVTNESTGVLKELDDCFKEHPRWTYRATPIRRVKRSAAKPKDAKPAVSVKLLIHFFGFRRVNGHQPNTYFYVIDPSVITGRTTEHIYPELSELDSLREFGNVYREFCNASGVKLCGTRGQFGAAMLRDPRFIGVSQRRIPAFINETARKHLPGNHYELRHPTQVPTEALYLDITNAHHTAAERTKFPDPSGLRARGFHRNPPEGVTGREPWARMGTPKYERILRTHGMFLICALYRGTPKGEILHPASRDSKSGRANYFYCYSNEIPLLEKSGFSILGVEAAWTSGRTSESLNNYARFAQESLRGIHPRNRSWMKLMFLATYGMLGKTPSKYQGVSNQQGKPYQWPTSSGWLDAQLVSTTKEHSPATTNVIALGMIQAETRRNVIETARYLKDSGVEVLALYADSIIVAADSQLPFLPAEWRVKTTLTNLTFWNAVSWSSNEEERLPGVSGAARRQRLLDRPLEGSEAVLRPRSYRGVERFGFSDGFKGRPHPHEALTRTI